MIAGSLPFARAATEALFDSTCTVTRDPEGDADDTYDPVTHHITGHSPSDATTIYAGPCRIRPGLARPTMEGGQTVFVETYAARLPVTAVGLRSGDVLTVVWCSTDPQVVGAEFTVDQVDQGSSSVTRPLVLVRRQRGTPS